MNAIQYNGMFFYITWSGKCYYALVSLGDRMEIFDHRNITGTSPEHDTILT